MIKKEKLSFFSSFIVILKVTLKSSTFLDWIYHLFFQSSDIETSSTAYNIVTLKWPSSPNDHPQGISLQLNAN